MSENYHFRNLVFEGGGVKGIAYVGVLEELVNRNILQNIQRVGGTSAGAINAILLALDYSPEQTSEILSDLNFNRFLDDSWGVVRDTKRLVDEFGWYKGDYFKDWIASVVEKKTGNPRSTFNDLGNLDFKELFLVGTNLSTGYSEVFSREHTPRVSVADAARISMSIPLFFSAVRSLRSDVYVDGGLLRNYPVKLFDREKYIDSQDLEIHGLRQPYYDSDNQNIPRTSSRYVYNKETLGFRLDSKEEISIFRDSAEPVASKVDDFFDYSKALIKTILNAQGTNHLHTDDWQRTVYIDTLGVETTDFDLSDSRKADLVESGKKGIGQYFDWYDNQSAGERSHNHPEFEIRN